MANFTDEQIAQLSGNQNVQWVSRTGVQFTPEFKLLAWEQKQQGRRMKDIFRDNGIDPDILGRKRIDTELQLGSIWKPGIWPTARDFSPAEAIFPQEYFVYYKGKWCTAGGKDPLFGHVDGFQIDPKIFKKDFNCPKGMKFIWDLFCDFFPYKSQNRQRH